jgi:CDGSH-type Zn-finger protein
MPVPLGYIPPPCREVVFGIQKVKRRPPMSDPVVAQKGPYPISVEAGKTYWWCACGKSQRQPLCDGSHAGGPFTPLAYTPEQSGTAYLCGCKDTKTSPLCDGSHKAL